MMSDPKVEEHDDNAELGGALEEAPEDTVEETTEEAPEPVTSSAPVDPTPTGKKRMGRPKKAETSVPSVSAPTPGNGDEPYMDARTRAELAIGAETQRKNAELLQKAK